VTRLNLLLLFVLVLCALGVVTSQHKARRAHIALDKEKTEAHRLEVEWGQLQLEQGTWAMHSRVEKEASSRLGMHVPDAAHLRVAPMKAGA
jgi:cell division protein FtsL